MNQTREEQIAELREKSKNYPYSCGSVDAGIRVDVQRRVAEVAISVIDSLQEEISKLKEEREEAIKQLNDIRGEDAFERIFQQQDHFTYEYQITVGMRKAWDGEPDLSLEGWELYKDWERFDLHEEKYWRRKKPSNQLTKQQS